MKSILTTFSVVVFASIVSYALLGISASAQPPGSYHHRWAVGEWSLVQYAPDGVSYTGRLRIHREGDWFKGRIYFDVVGRWESLQDVEVTHDSIRFTRATYQQKFDGHFRDGIIEGRYKDWLHHNEGSWGAQH